MILEIRNYRALLAKYGRHLWNCARSGPLELIDGIPSHAKCTCGLTEALKELGLTDPKKSGFERE